MTNSGPRQCRSLILVVFLTCLTPHVSSQEEPVYDHHVHLLSPRLIRDWKSIGMRFSRPDEAYSDPGLLLKSENLAGGFLISMAHLYTIEDFRRVVKTEEVERRMVAAENDFIAVCVATNPEKLLGFYSVNPLKKYAFAELNRCRANPNLVGLKLHLPACGIDLDDAKDMEAVKQALAWAAKHDVPVLMHLSSGEEISFPKSLEIWKSVIAPHAKLELYLAHLGSVGGYNSSSENLLHGYRRLAEQDAQFRKLKIFFDLSGAIIGKDSSEAEPTTDERCKKLSEQIRRIGINRFLFASDYPVFSISATRKILAKQLRLTAEESSKLLKNRSPRF